MTTLIFTRFTARILREFDKKHPNVLSDEERLYYEGRINQTFDGSNSDVTAANFLSTTVSAARNFHTVKLQNFFIPIFENPEPIETVLAKINTFKHSNALTADEQYELDKFTSVLVSSHEFWSVRSGQNPSNGTTAAKCDPEWQKYIADAAGLMFGGLGSIGYSALVYAIQKKHGGGCI